MEPGLVVYVNVDVLFLANFTGDLLWLWATSSMAGVQIRWWRAVATAVVGGAAGVWAVFPSGRWLATLPGLIFGTGLFLGMAFWPRSVRQAVRVGGYGLLAIVAMAGAGLLLGGRRHGAVAFAPTDLAPQLVAVGLLVSTAGIRTMVAAVRERARIARGLYGLRVQVGEAETELVALLDTGNDLREPLTGRSVLVAEARALQALLPQEVSLGGGETWDHLSALPPPWEARCRLVPYRAIGSPSGFLLAFAPDRLEVRLPKSDQWVGVDGLVGLAGWPLHPDGAYQALLSPPLVEGVLGKAWEGEAG